MAAFINYNKSSRCHLYKSHSYLHDIMYAKPLSTIFQRSSCSSFSRWDGTKTNAIRAASYPDEEALTVSAAQYPMVVNSYLSKETHRLNTAQYPPVQSITVIFVITG